MLPKILAVLNASFFKIQAMWQTPTLFSVPYPAYRLLIDFLQRDKVFCNDFIPVFRAHEVILYLKKDTDEKKHLQQADISYSCTSVAGVVPLKNTGEFTEKRVFVFMKEVGLDMRTVRRKPASERWDTENMKLLSGVPWRVSEDDPNIDGEKINMDVKVMDRHYEEKTKKEAEERVPRRMDITKRVLEICAAGKPTCEKKPCQRMHGYTQKCQGCRAVLLWHASQGHSEGCRARLEKAARGGPGDRDAVVRIDAYLEKVCSPGMQEAAERERKKRRHHEPETEAKEEEEVKDPILRGGRETTQPAGEGDASMPSGSGGQAEPMRTRRRPREEDEGAGCEEMRFEDAEGDVEIDEVAEEACPRDRCLDAARDEDSDECGEVFGYAVMRLGRTRNR